MNTDAEQTNEECGAGSRQVVDHVTQKLAALTGRNYLMPSQIDEIRDIAWRRKVTSIFWLHQHILSGTVGSPGANAI